MSSRNPHARKSGTRSFTPVKLLQASAPVAVALFGSIWLAGCDTAANQTDRKVQAAIENAQAQLAGGDAGGARKTLEAVASNADASPLTRAIAKGRLAEAEQDSATKIMQQIALDDQNLHRLIFEISQLANQVDTSRAIAANYDNYDPKKAQDAVTAQIAAAQGGPGNLDWIKQDNSSIPSLAAVTQTISQLQGELAKQADDLKALQDQRTQVLEEADKADKSSEISKGQQSVDDFKRGADLRKQAGDLTVQIEKNQAQTVPLQNDLAVAQGQQTVLQETIQQYQDQSKALEDGWKSVQAAVASQADLQKKILSAPAPAPAPEPTASLPGAPTATSTLPATAGLSLNDKADALKKLIDQIKGERSDALADLNNSSLHNRDAAKAGQEYFAILDPLIKEPANATRPEQDGWKNLQAVVHPAVYRLNEALALRQLGELHMGELYDGKRLSQLQVEVAKVLGAANLPVPSALTDATLDQQQKDASDAASAAYDAAEKEVDGITAAAPEPLFKLAKIQHVLTLYAQVQLDRAMGNDADAKQKLLDTDAARDEAIQTGLPLPPFPPELVAPPNPTGAAPAATPAS
jgi:hypothetical protein